MATSPARRCSMRGLKARRRPLTLVVAPAGSGKSVLLAFMALQFRRYAGAQVFAFDHGGSIRAGVLGVGGEWHDLGGALGGNSPPVALQPLARIDELD